MGTLKQQRVSWALANALGIGAFLAFASSAWIEPELAGEPGASAGDFVVWGASALPILLLFVVAHLIVGVIALKRGRWDWALPVSITTACWVTVALIDNAHHGI